MNIAFRHAGGRRNWPIAVALGCLSFALGHTATASPFAYIPHIGPIGVPVSVVNLCSNKVQATIDSRGWEPAGVAVSPDATRVFVAAFNDSLPHISDHVSVIDTATNTIINTVSMPGGAGGVAVTPEGSRVYVANKDSNTVSVFFNSTKAIFATIPVGQHPDGIAVTADGGSVYVANASSNTVSAIETVNNKVIATIPVERIPKGVAVSSKASRVYVANSGSNTVSVISTGTNSVVATVPVGESPFGVAASRHQSRVYVTNLLASTVSVIDTATDTVVATIPVGYFPSGIDLNRAGTRVYVTNTGSEDISVIDTETNTVLRTVNVGTQPLAFGQFIADGPNLTEDCRTCQTTADLRSGGSTDRVRVTNQGPANVPYTVQFVNAQGTVQGQAVSDMLTPDRSASSTIGTLLQQAGIRSFNPALLLQVVTDVRPGIPESWLQSVYTPTNGTPPVMMVYACEPASAPK